MSELTTYFSTRMAALGITATTMHFTAQHLGQPVQRTRFEETERGDIRIHYYRLDGTPYTFHQKKADDGNRDWAKPYYRDRLQVPTITEVTENGITKQKERKYQSPKGSHNCPYFTPQIIEAYTNKTKIPLLVLTEGEFKAVAGCNAGLHVVGITGIQGFYDPDGSKKLHFDIIELCRACQVEKILLLTDADTLTLTYKPDTDLAQRPVSFYSSVKNFREAAMLAITTGTDLMLRDAYFGHIDRKHVATGKGLDDLLQTFAHNKDSIVNSLNALSFNSQYFYIQNITDGLNKISQHFGLTGPQDFYTVYQEYLTDNEFKYKKQTYRWIADEERLHKILHEDIQKFVRVGCDWFKEVWVPSKYGLLAEVKKWKVGEIQRDYIKQYPTFLDDIPKMEAWANEPAMHREYRRVIDNKEFGKCYNLFNPMPIPPAPGNIYYTVLFLKHLFKGKATIEFETTEGRFVAVEDIEPAEYIIVDTAPVLITDENRNDYKGKQFTAIPTEIGKRTPFVFTGNYREVSILKDPFTIALDYLNLMYAQPKIILPVLCLVSPENNTGKSTFLKWLRDIYGSNATVIDNERFQMSFNSHYITKHVIGIDEGFLDVEKKKEKERLKKMATDDRQYLEFKGSDVYEIDFYGKIIIASNDADNLMKIEDGEIRWWVVRVHPFTKELPDLREKLMRPEIPAWLNFLQNREVVHPKIGRAWFDPEVLKTEQLQIIIEKTRNRIDKVVDEFIIDKLKTFQPFGCTYFKLDLRGLVEAITKEGYSKYKLDTTDLKNYLKDKKGMNPGAPSIIRYPTNIRTTNGIVEPVYDTSRVARCYMFEYDKWVTGKHLDEPETPDTTTQPEQPTTTTEKVNLFNKKHMAAEENPFGTEGTKYDKK